MCLNCGCGMKDNDMGNPKNITLTSIAEAAKASSMNGKDTLDNLKEELNKLSVEEVDKKIEKLGQ